MVRDLVRGDGDLTGPPALGTLIIPVGLIDLLLLVLGLTVCPPLLHGVVVISRRVLEKGSPREKGTCRPQLKRGRTNNHDNQHRVKTTNENTKHVGRGKIFTIFLVPSLGEHGQQLGRQPRVPRLLDVLPTRR